MTNEMCKDCFNFRPNGTCKITWISIEEMQVRANAGYCDDYKLVDVSGSDVDADRLGYNAGGRKVWITKVKNNKGF